MDPVALLSSSELARVQTVITATAKGSARQHLEGRSVKVADRTEFNAEGDIPAHRWGRSLPENTTLAGILLASLVATLVSGTLRDFGPWPSAALLAVLCVALVAVPRASRRDGGRGRHPRPPVASALRLCLYALLATLVGGALWDLWCNVVGWPGALVDRGLHRSHAFLWGVIGMLPAVFSAFLVIEREHPCSSAPAGLAYRRPAVFWAFLAAYPLLTGLAAIVFYDGGVRAAVESRHFGYLPQELLIAATWSLLIGLLTYLSYLLPSALAGAATRTAATPGLVRPLIQLPILVVTSLAAVGLATLVFGQDATMRGLVAGFASRLSVFVATVVIFDGLERFHATFRILAVELRRPD